jgi:hypothetical protein
MSCSALGTALDLRVGSGNGRWMCVRNEENSVRELWCAGCEAVRSVEGSSREGSSCAWVGIGVMASWV